MSLNTNYFNEKYKDYIAVGHYGLEISNPKVIEYLDSVFERENKENLKIFQIKTKFNMARVYLDEQHSELASILEKDIDAILAYYNNPFPEKPYKS